MVGILKLEVKKLAISYILRECYILWFLDSNDKIQMSNFNLWNLSNNMFKSNSSILHFANSPTKEYYDLSQFQPQRKQNTSPLKMTRSGIFDDGIVFRQLKEKISLFKRKAVRNSWYIFPLWTWFFDRWKKNWKGCLICQCSIDFEILQNFLIREVV